MKDRKVLITGVNGFIGNKIACYYLEKGNKVFGIDIEGSILRNKDVEFYGCNLENDDVTEIYRKIKPDLMIHCAGNASVALSVENPQLDFNRNVGVLYKTLNELKRSECNPKVIFLSSAAVYGNPEELPISENSPLKPISPYGLNKKICEDICMYYNQNENMDIKMIRIFSAYGEGLKKQIIWDMFCKLKNTGKIELFGTGNETRDFIHVDDIIRAIDLIVDDKKEYPIYNVASGVEVSVRELAEVFAEASGSSKDVIQFNNMVKEGDPLNWRADISKIAKLGFQPKISLYDGITRYINWAKEC